MSEEGTHRPLDAVKAALDDFGGAEMGAAVDPAIRAGFVHDPTRGFGPGNVLDRMLLGLRAALGSGEAKLEREYALVFDALEKGFYCKLAETDHEPKAKLIFAVLRGFECPTPIGYDENDVLTHQQIRELLNDGVNHIVAHNTLWKR